MEKEKEEGNPLQCSCLENPRDGGAWWGLTESDTTEATQQQQDILMDFPGGSDGKASVYNTGDPGSVPEWGRYPGEGNGNPLQYSCWENPMDREAWWATVHGVTKSQTGLSNFTFTFKTY